MNVQDLQLANMKIGLILDKKSHQQGVKLMGPGKNTDQGLTVGKLFNLPLNIIFLDHESSSILDINERNASTLGCQSPQQAIGKKIHNFYKENAADFSIKHDLETLNSEMLIIKEEFCERRDNTLFQVITAKVPCYNAENVLIGIMGYSIPLNLGYDFQNAMSAFCKLTNTINSRWQPPLRNIHGIYLTSRESQCLHYVREGKTSKMIGKILNLSPRTIEQYMTKIKIKFKVTSKTELMEKILNDF
jgi:DNA-binding CsgD family transcriptional regulator